MSKNWSKQPVFIQSFAPTSLVYISNMTDSPKIFLIDDVTIPTQDTNQVYSQEILPTTACSVYLGLLCMSFHFSPNEIFKSNTGSG